MKNIHTLSIFPTIIATYDLSDIVHTLDTTTILQQSTVDNNLVDGSRLDIQPHSTKEYKTLFEEIKICIDDYSNSLYLRESNVYESWINVLRKQGSVGSHRHYGGVISGALYLIEEDESSYLYFINPTEGYRMMEMQYVKNYDNEYTPNIYPITPKTGHLVLFPSWIEHFVGVNNSNLRVTLSFNTR
jgi:uncharacterized protein (TIGR02466 family)